MLAQIVLSERRGVITKTKNHLLFRRIFSANHNQAHQTLSQRKHIRVESTLFDTVTFKFIFISISYTSYWQKRTTIFSVHNDANDWSPDFGPDLVTLTVQDPAKKWRLVLKNSFGSLELVVVEKTTLCKQPSSASSNYPKQGWDDGDRNSVISSLCAQDMNTSG